MHSHSQVRETHLVRYLAMAVAILLVLALVPVGPASADEHLTDFDVLTLEVSAPAEGTADVVVVHGIPGVVVDVVAGGTTLIEDFEYGDLETFEGLPPGSYELEVVAGGETVLSLDADLEADTSYSVAAYLDLDEAPVLEAWVNETEYQPGAQVFHLAQYPRIDIGVSFLNLFPFENLGNGEVQAIPIDNPAIDPGDTLPTQVFLTGERTAQFSLPITVSEQLLLAFAIGPEGGNVVPDEPTDPVDPVDPVDPTEPETPAVPGFTDVDPDSVHAAAIAALVEAEITTGITEDTFGPSQIVRRDQMATFLARALELDVDPDAVPEFTDVDPDSVHAPSIAALVAAEITTGITEDTFGPSQEVRRDQMATFLTRGFELEVPAEIDLPFVDVPEESVHREAIAALVEAEITGGTTETTFSPQAGVRRDQMATFLARALGLV